MSSPQEARASSIRSRASSFRRAFAGDPPAEADGSTGGRFWRGPSSDAVNGLARVFGQGTAWLIVIAGVPLRHALDDPTRRVVEKFEQTLSGDDSAWSVRTTSHDMW